MDLPEQHTGLEQVGRDLVEQKVRRHHRAHRFIGGAPDSVVHDAKLRAKLTGHAGTVDRAQRVLPEAPSNGQQGIVVHQDGLVVASRGNAGACEVTIDLPGACVQRGLDLADAIRTLRQHHPPDHGLDVVVRKLDVDREPAL